MSEPDASDRQTAGERASLERFGRLKRRAEFQRVARGSRWRSEAFVLQAMRRREPSPDGPRIGLTATTRTGGAVERNRLRRRLKEALRLAGKLAARPDYDYVLVARREALSRPFDLLRADLNQAFAAVHAGGSRPSSDRDRSR